MRSQRSIPAYLGFVVVGMVTTLLGPILSELAKRWSLDDRHAGYLFTAQFLGSMLGVGLTSLVAPRIGFPKTLGLGYLFLALGLIAVGRGSWLVGLTAVAGYGVGVGIAIPATNLWVAEVAGANRARSLHLLNLAWAAGAIVFPPLVAVTLRRHDLSFLFLPLAGASFVMAITIFASGRQRNRVQEVGPAIPEDATAPTDWLAWSVLAVLFLLYVGAESSISGWVASYVERMHLMAGTLWAATPAIFWAALLAGRALAAAHGQRLSERVLLQISMAVAAAGILILIGATSIFIAITGILIAGLGMAPAYPLLVSELSHRFGRGGARLRAPTFAFGGLGGATLPWLVGAVSEHSQSLRLALVVPLVAMLLMMALERAAPRPSPSPVLNGP